jgi:hypothetical protein
MPVLSSRSIAGRFSTARARSASSKTMLVDLPPSSKVTFFTVRAASSATRVPARVEPVKLTMSTSAWLAITSPTTGPRARDQVEDAAGSTGSMDALGNHQGTEWRHLAGHEDDGAPHDERRADLTTTW